jgi:predicted ATPase
VGVASAFVGREAERAALAELVSACRLVTVTGPGGMGKTRLADETAGVVGGHFPGGVRRCELSPLEPSAGVGVAVASALGFGGPEALAVGLGDAPSLLVLDNCEHVLAGAAALAALLLEQAPEVHLLATSQAPLGVEGEQLLVLGPLGLPDGDDAEAVLRSPVATLYLDRARAAGASWEADGAVVAALGELCRRLDGIPLAIELAAARARTLSPVEVLDHLDERLDLLKRRTRDGPARHGSLRAVIDTSYRLLDEDEQALFRRASVFAGPFDAYLAHDVLAGDGRDRIDTLDLLATLVDRSMVVASARGGATRYRLLDSLRQYAAERRDEAGEGPATVEAFVDRMVAEAGAIVVEGMRSWSGELLARIAEQFGNLVAALDRCLTGDDRPDRAYVLLLPLYGAIHQARYHEVAAVGRRVLARWPDAEGPGRYEATAVVAMATLGAGSLDEAAGLARRCVDAGDEASALARFMALRVLGFRARAAGDLVGSAASFRQAQEAARDAPAFARDLAVSEAAVVGAAGDLDRALDQLQAVVAEAVAAGDPINEVRARMVVAALLVRAGRGPAAAPEIEAVRALGEGAGYRWAVGVARRLEGVLVAVEAGWEASLPQWRAALDEFTPSGDLREVALTLRLAAGAAARTGEAGVAATLLGLAPPQDGVTLQPDLFADELAALEAEGRGGPSAPPATAVRRARAVLAGEGAGEVGDVAVPPPPAGASLVREGEGWTVAFAGRSVQVRHRKGMDDLAALLARPEVEVHCLELMGAVDVGGGAGPVLDDEARRQYQRRITELQEEVDDAAAANDPARGERAEQELDALVEQLTAAFGLSGRARSTGAAAERARSAVTFRLRSAIGKLAELHPELGRHLENAVRTGTWCSYRPEGLMSWDVRSS